MIWLCGDVLLVQMMTQKYFTERAEKGKQSVFNLCQIIVTQEGSPSKEIQLSTLPDLNKFTAIIPRKKIQADRPVAYQKCCSLSLVSNFGFLETSGGSMVLCKTPKSSILVVESSMQSENEFAIDFADFQT